MVTKVVISGWSSKNNVFTVLSEDSPKWIKHIRPKIDRSLDLVGPRGALYLLEHRVDCPEHSFWEMRSRANRFFWKKVDIIKWI